MTSCSLYRSDDADGVTVCKGIWSVMATSWPHYSGWLR